MPFTKKTAKRAGQTTGRQSKAKLRAARANGLKGGRPRTATAVHKLMAKGMSRATAYRRLST